MSDRLLTVQEVADFLRLKRQTIYVMVMRRQIPHLKLSTGVLRFDPDEIRKFLEEKKQPACTTGG